MPYTLSSDRPTASLALHVTLQRRALVFSLRACNFRLPFAAQHLGKVFLLDHRTKVVCAFMELSCASSSTYTALCGSPQNLDINFIRLRALSPSEAAFVSFLMTFSAVALCDVEARGGCGVWPGGGERVIQSSVIREMRLRKKDATRTHANVGQTIYMTCVFAEEIMG